MNNKTRVIAASAIIGAAYAVMTIVLAPISYGAIQFRLSEALCVMPFFLPGSAWGLFMGCIIANLMTGNVFDIVFGSLATLFAGLCTAALGRGKGGLGTQLLACFMPVIFNALVVGAVITSAYNGMSIADHPGVFALNSLQVGAGEAAVMYLVGLPLMRILPGNKAFREFIAKCA